MSAELDELVELLQSIEGDHKRLAAVGLAALYKALTPYRCFNRLVENQLDQIKQTLVGVGWVDDDLNPRDQR